MRLTQVSSLNISSTHVNRKNVGFERIFTRLKEQIFKENPKFHSPPICNHVMKVVKNIGISVCFLGDSMMDKFICATNVNEDDGFEIFEVVN